VNDIQKFRCSAEDCLRIAQKMTDSDDKLRLIDMAQAWLTLAERVSDARAAGVPMSAEGPNPALLCGAGSSE
jgi:hypothetical protein